MSGREFSEEELRQIEAEMERITVDDVLLQTLVTLLNLGARRAGLGAQPGQEAPQADLAQMRLAIEGARALLPLVQERHGEQLGPIRDALSRLQMAYTQLAQGQPAAAGAEPPEPGGPEAPGEAPPKEEPGKPGEPGPAQKSGRLWVPGQ
jgi:hypothetical protein